MQALIKDCEEIEIVSRGQRWLSSWHPPGIPPCGKNHGAAGICINSAGEIVIISSDEISWDFPAGRPEGDENWEQTLRREMLEEACAIVIDSRLLGFSSGRKVAGEHSDDILIRSIWLAHVELLDWIPQFEIGYRKLVSPSEAIKTVLPEFEPIWARAFFEAGIG